ncbi:MAG: hypothetical protein AB1424_04115, partial [Thermodesulfobacteriota bacterium]
PWAIPGVKVKVTQNSTHHQRLIPRKSRIGNLPHPVLTHCYFCTSPAYSRQAIFAICFRLLKNYLQIEIQSHKENKVFKVPL